MPSFLLAGSLLSLQLGLSFIFLLYVFYNPPFPSTVRSLPSLVIPFLIHMDMYTHAYT